MQHEILGGNVEDLLNGPIACAKHKGLFLTKIAVLSGSVEMGWLQAVSLNLSPPVYARIWV